MVNVRKLRNGRDNGLVIANHDIEIIFTLRIFIFTLCGKGCFNFIRDFCTCRCTSCGVSKNHEDF